MDFKDSIKQISERIDKLKDNLPTEESTKNALIMPFLQALGYDVFNPLEVLPEMTCDIGTKKGEKIDYAIIKDGNPIILIECKHWAQELSLHDNQLLRYFHVSKAKFGLLTNGIIYKFYTDLAEPNRMDEKPFLEINMLDLKDVQIEELKKFHKSYFDLDKIINSASELKYTSELKSAISKEFSNPSPEFVKFFVKQIYDGSFTSRIAEQFKELVRKSIAGLISDAISDRLKTALKTESEDENKIIKDTEQESITEKDDKIVTTDEEIEAFYIVMSIIRTKIAPERIFFRDAQTYSTVIIDNNNRKPICRFYLNSQTNCQISIIGQDKKEIKNKIERLDDIYKHSEDLLRVAQMYV